MTAPLPVYLNALGLNVPVGNGKTMVCEGLYRGALHGMQETSSVLLDGTTKIAGHVQTPLPAISTAVPGGDSRNNQLLLSAVLEIEADIRAAIDQYGPDRVAVIIGTSTSGISDGEAGVAYQIEHGVFPEGYCYPRQEMITPSAFLRDHFGLCGPAYTVSTACTSSSKALGSARRLLRAGFADAVIIGGADSLCRLTLNGFNALEALSPGLCNPFSVHRDGINIGEGAAVFLMSHQPRGVSLLGLGESSDAYHISAPDPTGKGAERAMARALDDAGLAAQQIDYLNLHGTATALNDAMESRAVHALFGPSVLCGSTKPMCGHMLGAAGAGEVAFLWLSLHPEFGNGRLPPHLWDGQEDPDLPALSMVEAGAHCDLARDRAMMSNSFAFGGNNISVILGSLK